MKQVLTSGSRQMAIAAVFVGIAVLLRGRFLGTVWPISPDEAEFMGQARAALRSLAPFTTWTTSTTGPIWVWFLALLGTLGAPLTVAFAHFIAAVFVGLLGYLGFTVTRRGLGTAASIALTVFWWLPIVFVLAGLPVDFASLSTELLPCALIFGAALVRPEALARRPLLYLVAGLLSGLALGSKYQVLPLALAVLAVQVTRAGDYRRRTIVRAVLLWVGGVAAPLAVVGLTMLLSSGVSTVAIQQNLNFLAYYSQLTTFAERLSNWRSNVTQMHAVLLVFLVFWLGVRSEKRIQLGRAVLVLGGLAAVLMGGMVALHYLYFMYTAIVLALALPIEPGARIVPYARQNRVAVAMVAAATLIGWLVSFGPSLGAARRAHRTELATAFSANGGARPDPRLVAACPPGSTVLVWGWAPEMYAYYSWNNAIPFLNVVQLMWPKQNYASGYDLIRRAVEDGSTECVVDAVGPPFFGMPASSSLIKHYPQVATLLEQKFQPAGAVVDCQECTVYVRRTSGGTAAGPLGYAAVRRGATADRRSRMVKVG